MAAKIRCSAVVGDHNRGVRTNELYLDTELKHRAAPNDVSGSISQGPLGHWLVLFKSMWALCGHHDIECKCHGNVRPNSNQLIAGQPKNFTIQLFSYRKTSWITSAHRSLANKQLIDTLLPRDSPSTHRKCIPINQLTKRKPYPDKLQCFDSAGQQLVHLKPTVNLTDVDAVPGYAWVDLSLGVGRSSDYEPGHSRYDFLLAAGHLGQGGQYGAHWDWRKNRIANNNDFLSAKKSHWEWSVGL